jgi:hypothetical protein
VSEGEDYWAGLPGVRLEIGEILEEVDGCRGYWKGVDWYICVGNS